MEYTLNITGISEPGMYVHGIYMVYTWYITCICRPQRYVRYIPCQDLMGLFRTFFYNDIPLIYYEYLRPLIYLPGSDIPVIFNVYSMYILYILY